ncbi:MAG: hypothetical protein V7K89_06695, partial [Nostoc sp.]|uniref:hypothetical protein n=1 Tax=Nostoc sp. TaxID=1180 RepID=UPI002FFC1DC6
MKYCFVEFQVDDSKRFNALCEVFYEIKKDKDNNSWRNEKNWLIFFDSKALSHFWWPSEEEEVLHNKGMRRGFILCIVHTVSLRRLEKMEKE